MVRFFNRRSTAKRGVLHARRGLGSIWSPLSGRERLVYGGALVLLAVSFVGPRVGANLSDAGSILLSPASQCSADDGGWQGAAQAEGAPEVDSNQLSSEITVANAASSSGSAAPITCFDFAPTDDNRIDTAVTLSLKADDADQSPAISEDLEDQTKIDEPGLSLNTASTALTRRDARKDPVEPNQYDQSETSILDGVIRVDVSADLGETWQTLHLLGSEIFSERSPHTSIMLPERFASDLSQLAVRIEHVSASEEVTLLLDSIFVSYVKGAPRELSISPKDSRSVGPDQLPVISDSQSPQFELRAKASNDGFLQGVSSRVADTVTGEDKPFVSLVAKVQNVRSGASQEVDASAEWTRSDLANADAWDVTVDMPADSAPGTYSLELAVTTEEGEVQAVTQDFLWGVLAINTDKTAYLRNQTGEIHMSVLDQTGAPVCDANVSLEIEAPNGSTTVFDTASNTIAIGENCEVYGDHIDPDFFVSHTYSASGEHVLTLSATTENGSFTITDSVLVEDQLNADIVRRGPTRIFPPVDYAMLIDVTPTDEFSGSISEFVPSSFEIDAASFAVAPTRARQANDRIELIWDVSLAAGETITLGYEFDPPDIAPEFYLLGPAKLFNTQEETVFEEHRQWQIASDAIGDLAIYRDSNGTHDTDNGAYTGVPFNAIETEGSAFTQNANDIDVDLGDGGHYLYGYVVQARNDTYNNRISYRSRITLGGSEEVSGQGSGYRRNTTNDRYYAYGYGVLDATAGDDARVEVIRQGTNTSAHALEADRSSLWFLKLDDGWDYARLTGQDNQATTVATQNINFTAQTELDSGSYTHNTGSNPDEITLTQAGNYLVTYTVGVDGATERTSITTNLTLNGSDVEQSFDYCYMRFTNSTTECNATNMTIIEASANDILRLEWGATGAALANSTQTRSDRTAINIVKLPNDAEYLRVHESTTAQDIGGGGTNIVSHDTEDQEDSGSFNHNNGTGVTTINTTADYLFTAGARTNRGTTGSTRMTAGGAWFVDGVRETVGNTGMYTRGDQGTPDTFDGGWSAAGLFSLNSGQTIDFREIDEGDDGNADQFQPDSYGITAVNIDTLFTPPAPSEINQLHYRWRDDTNDLNTTGGWLAAEDTDPASVDKLETTRLRMEIANEGGDEATGRTYELQFADMSGYASCSAIPTWTGIEDSSSDAIAMSLTSNIDPDGESATSSLLANSETYTYTNGEGRKSADTTNTIGPLTANYFTELEFSLELTDEAVIGHTYCFRLYDATNNLELDNYDVFPTLSAATGASASGLGEAGTFTSAADGGWTTINFAGSYTTPVVVGLSNSHNGQEALVFQAQTVTGTSAQMRLCESEGSTSLGCDTHIGETVGYMVIDAAVAATTAGIEAGTFTTSGADDSTNVTTNFGTVFGSTPFVLANTNTATDADQPTEVIINSRSTTQFNAGICQHLLGSDDLCDTGHGTETVGWVAIEPGNEPFFEDFRNNVLSIDTDGTNWQAITFTPAFVETPALLMASQTDAGGQDLEIDQGRSVTTAGADIRFCELDATDTCDTHAADTVGWLAIEQGEFTDRYDLDMDGYRFYESENNVQPTVALGNENEAIVNVDDTDEVRIRMAIQNGMNEIAASSFDLTLQFAEIGATCSAATGWTDVGADGSGVIWRGNNEGGGVNDGDSISASLLDGGTNELMSFEEENDSVTNPNAISDGERGEWDWLIENNNAPALTTYCFRVVLSNGDTVQYTRYPTITTASAEAPLDPDDPTNLAQEKTTATTIATGDYTNETSVVFKADVSDQNTADVLKLCVEVQPIGVAFTDTETACGATVAYSGTALEAEVTINSLTAQQGYHWQAQVEDSTATRSNWVSYGGNAETAEDFIIDNLAPSFAVFDGTTTGVDIDYNNGDLDELSANWALDPESFSSSLPNVLWLDGSDVNGNGIDPSDGDPILTWTDKSGNGNDIGGTGDATYDATEEAIAFSDDVQPFDDNYDRTGGNGNSQAMFAVVTGNASTSNHVWFETTTPRIAPAENGLLGGGTSLTSNNLWSSHMTSRQQFSLIYDDASGDSFGYLDRLEEYTFTETQSFANSQRLVIGDDTTGGNRLETGEFVHEILVFNDDLTEQERVDVQNYLACKWSTAAQCYTSSITLYEYSIGTSPGGTDVVGWTSNGTSTSITATSLNLNTSQPYYFNVRATDDAGNQTIQSSDGIFIAPTLSFSTSPGNVLFESLNPGNSFTDTEVTTLTTSTNAYNGYTIRAFVTGQLTNQLSDTIGFFNGGTYASPDEWGSGDVGYGYTSNDTSIQGSNIFNNTPCPGGGNPPCYAPFATTGPGDIIADHTSLVSGSPVTNENFLITHRVTTADNQAPGIYDTNVIYVITASY